MSELEAAQVRWELAKLERIATRQDVLRAQDRDQEAHLEYYAARNALAALAPNYEI